MKKITLLFWIIISWISYPFLSFLAKKRAQKGGGGRRILVLPQLSRIGDIVCSTPVFYNIKKTYPDSYISVLISKKAFGILKNNKRIDNFIFIEDYPSYTKLINKIKEEGFNWSINLSATSINTCLSLWGLIQNRIKTVVETPPITERLTDWMNNYKLPYKNHTYLPKHHTKLLEFMGIYNPEDKKEIEISENAENKISEWIKNIPQNKKIIGLSITAGNKIKELGDDKFIELAKKILELEDVLICCIGSKNDAARLDLFIKNVNNQRCFKAPDVDLEELPSLIKRFSLYIAVDTGPIYIANTLGVPLIDIIGPVDPKEQPPFDNKSIQLLPRNNIEPSSFVFKKRGSKIDIEKALNNTYVDDIFIEVKKILNPK